MSELRILPVQPGERWALMSALMRNVSDTPLHLLGVSLDGDGLGSVVHVSRFEIGPIDPSPTARDTTSGGVFKTYPPAILAPGESECRIQSLVPVEGFLLRPDGEARILVLMEATEPGAFQITAHVVEYRQGDQTLVQELPIGMSGEVALDGKPMKPASAERACEGHTRFLPAG